MIPQALARRFPRLYHMAELDSWPRILERGLLSTSALLDLFQVSGVSRSKLESEWRSSSTSLSHPEHGDAVIRDQIPMPESSLQHLLVGLTPKEWYQLINGKTFFWVDTQRLGWMLKAPQYRTRPHAIFVVDTHELLERHLPRVTLSDQNSGSVYSGRRRGLETFKRVEEYPSRWVAELAVQYSVPDIDQLTIRIEEWRADIRAGVIWERAQ